MFSRTRLCADGAWARSSGFMSSRRIIRSGDEGRLVSVDAWVVSWLVPEPEPEPEVVGAKDWSVSVRERACWRANETPRSRFAMPSTLR